MRYLAHSQGLFATSSSHAPRDSYASSQTGSVGAVKKGVNLLDHKLVRLQFDVG